MDFNEFIKGKTPDEKIVTVRKSDNEVPYEYDEFLVILVPQSKEKDFERDFDMAVKYSQVCIWEENPEDYDEYFEEMAQLREEVNGTEAFMVYMERMGYKVHYLSFDYEFEW